METNPPDSPIALPEPTDTPNAPQLTAEQRRATIIIIVVALVLLLIIVASFVFLMRAPALQVAQLRDVMIIFLALQSVLTGFVLVILLVQLARLINLLQNEIKPILESTNDTVNHLRGTTTFLGEPVIKMNEYLAGITKFLVVMGIYRKSK
jgi:membrane protein implicated in regulation of membrane protease activity